MAHSVQYSGITNYKRYLSSKGAANIPKAALTGGTLLSDSTHYYRVFSSSGTLSVSNNSLVTDILIVAGGGGGGRRVGGGGGGGGVVVMPSYTLDAQSYSVVVGSGGTGATSNSVYGTRGVDSSFATITAIGGGAGQIDANSSTSVINGGSGGGGDWDSNGGDNGISIQTSPVNGISYGNAGGAKGGSLPITGGGGGGAGAVGSTTVQNGGTGKGGNGIYLSNFLIAGTDASNQTSGSNLGYYAGGGGAGNWSGEPRSYSGDLMQGGIGGGGRGESANSAGSHLPGIVNTGGGGGADGRDERVGASGGSGIVIVRYPKSAVE